MYPPVFGANCLGAGQSSTALRRLGNALLGAGHVAVLHGESLVTERFTGRNGEISGIAAFGELYKAEFAQNFHPC